MRGLLAGMILCASSAYGQAVGAAAAVSPAAVSPAVDAYEAALVGRWAGVLEYRDYQSGAGEDKRVKLPTWASINLTKAGYRVEYTYDDGPGKTVTEKLDVTMTEGAEASYVSTKVADATAKKAEATDTVRFAVAGLEKLKNGRGTLVLTGTITENGKPTEARTTVTLRRNVLEIVKETHAAGEPFRFRDGYTLTRLTPLYEPPTVH